MFDAAAMLAAAFRHVIYATLRRAAAACAFQHAAMPLSWRCRCRACRSHERRADGYVRHAAALPGIYACATCLFSRRARRCCCVCLFAVDVAAIARYRLRLMRCAAPVYATPLCRMRYALRDVAPMLQMPHWRRYAT